IPQIRVRSDLLRADVGERHLREIECLPPPALGLRREPGVENRDARRADRMRLYRRRRADGDDREPEVGRGALQVRLRYTFNNVGPSVELLARGVESFFC